MGQALMAEYESVLARAEPFAASPIDESDRDAPWAALAGRCRWVRIYFMWRPNLPDEADNNHVAELAVAGGADNAQHARLRAGRTAFSSALRVLSPGELMAED